MTLFFNQLWFLLRLCILGAGGKRGIVYFIIVLLLNLLGVSVAVRLIDWYKDFYSALGKLDVDTVIIQLGVYLILLGMSAGLFLVSNYIRKLLYIRWRATLTDAALEKWLANKTYWFLSLNKQNSLLDNPDQRIAEDCRQFVDKFTDKVPSLINNIVALFSYFYVLWQCSDFALTFAVFDNTIAIPHYLVIAAPLYVLICSGLTHLLGSPLMRLNVEQKKREADFRFALTRLRESTESIALENGEYAERGVLNQRFTAIVANWKRLMNRDFILGLFTRPYNESIFRVPLFFALPMYLAGHVDLGGLMAASVAFQKVATNLSWFIFYYRDMADLAASSRRLNDFFSQMEVVNSKQNMTIELQDSTQNTLQINQLTVNDLQGRPLLTIPKLLIKPGESVWLSGPSGIGKSTLIKTIAGLWPHGSGQIFRPAGRCLFLSQKPYLPIGNLNDAISYPDERLVTDKVRELMQQVGLICPRHNAILNDNVVTLDGYGFSGGEQQRLIMARILAIRPDWVFLDETTSALDVASEAQLLQLLRTNLPNAGFIIIAHRKPEGLNDLRYVQL